MWERDEDCVDCQSQDIGHTKSGWAHEYLVIGWVKDKWDTHRYYGSCLEATQL